MNALIHTINAAGRAFVDFAAPMLIQSVALILVLLLVDLVLRRRVRAVFRYWMWMLVLLKLMLPPSLCSPVSFGTWFGETLETPTAILFEAPAPQAPDRTDVEQPPTLRADDILPYPPIAKGLALDAATQADSTGRSERRSSSTPPRTAPQVPASAETDITSPAPALSWQALALLAWAAVALALLLLLLQRAWFVRGLVAQAQEAPPRLKTALDECRARMGLPRPIVLRVSPNASSPAVCGLWRPVILIPKSLAPRMQPRDLQAVLLHELAHVKRGDLWVNLVQTLLQIVYFYNPLFWLANVMIRRVREQAVDEAVLVAMGETAHDYPETLLSVAKLAFHKRPALSLRLIGVVESKSALSGRIKHILTRPLPQSAKLGLVGLVIVFLLAAVLLPMARAAESDLPFTSDGGPLDIELVAVRPNAGHEFYEPTGKRLDWDPGFLPTLAFWGPDWRARDFILKVPDTNQPVLFANNCEMHPVDTTQHKTIGGPVPMGRYEGAQLFEWSLQVPRRCNAGEVLGLIPRSKPVHHVDLTLRYFHGPPQDPICSFTGPFAAGQTVSADGDDSYTVTCQQTAFLSETVATHRFTFSDNVPRDDAKAIIVYTADGRRHLPDIHGMPQTFFDWHGPLNQITTITFGERPHECVFHNVAVRYHGDSSRPYAPHLDRMAAALGQRELPKEDLALYNLQTPDKALAVIDIVRSRYLIGQALDLITAAERMELSRLDEATRRRLRPVAQEWANSLDLNMRIAGVQLGLLADGPEFVDRALPLLRDDYHYLPDTGNLSYNLQQISLLLWHRYPDRLTPEQYESLEAYTRGIRTLPILGKVAGLRPASANPATVHDNTMSAVRQHSDGDVSTEDDSSSPGSTATLSNGTTVELIGVCDHPSTGKQWWRADGSLLEQAPCEYSGVLFPRPRGSETAYEFVVRLANLPDGASVTLKTEPGGMGRPEARPDGLRRVTVTLPGDLKECQLLCDVAAGPWETAASSNGTLFSPLAVRSDPIVFTEGVGWNEGGVTVTASDDILEHPHRIVAITKNGDLVDSHREIKIPWAKVRETTAYFKDIPRDQIAEFQLQIRPWTRARFHHVSLRRAQKTRVTVSVDPPETRAELAANETSASVALPLTARAQKVMPIAEQEARRLNHAYVGTEHILLALARQKDAISARVLANLGADIDTLRAEVNKFVRPGPEPVTQRTLPLTPRAEQVIKYAREEADALGHQYIGTEHLLLGLVREREGVAAQVLANLHATLPRIRADVLSLVRAGRNAKLNHDAPGTDSDGDGLSDFQEVHKYLTDPARRDSDGDGTPDGDWAERREYTYSVRSIFRFLPPLEEGALNDDFQDARVLKQTNDYVEIEVIHYPLATVYESIDENRNWQQDYAHLTEYLAPGVTTNWDAPMRRALLADLKADGIDVATLSDKQVVERVSDWMLKRSRSLDKVFTTFYVHCPNGRPEVFPDLQDAFQGEFERDKNNYDWTIEEHFDHEVLGKGMFYNKTHGSCTSTAVYLTTALRALGIPTRMVLVSPAVDASDREQILMVKNSITHNRVRETMLAGLRRSSHGFTNHTFNEVYVGNRWVRLDYTTLGAPILGVHRFGLQTHLYTIKDLSDVDLAATWGVRYAKGLRSEYFQHSNPYTAVEIDDSFGVHSHIGNPPFMAQDLRTPSKPDIFVFSPSQARVWDDILEIVKDATYNKTGRPHQREYYENLFEGVWQTNPGDIVLLLFALDAEDRVPAGYEDLLPRPWAQIEASLKQGETVELAGEARDMKIILLAAPRAAQLTSLVRNSTLLSGLGSSAGNSVAAKQPGWLVEFTNGLKVRLLGVCTHPSAGKQWWSPDGTPLEAAPYETTGSLVKDEEGYVNCEYAAHVSGARDVSIRWRVPGGTRSSDTGQAIGSDGERLPHTYAYTANQPLDTEVADVFMGVTADEWETRAVHATPNREGSYTLKDDYAIAFGSAYEKDDHVYVPITTNIKSVETDTRLVAVDDVGQSHTGSRSGYGGNVLNSTTYTFDLAFDRIKEFHFQTRPYLWVTFHNVSLRRGQKTDFKVDFAAAYNPDAADSVTLPDVDHEAVMLDLASGQLVEIPQDASESNMAEAILALGRGDLVHDGNALILVRNATSERAEKMTGAPFITCPIGSHLPQVLQVTTAEGHCYEVTILAVDEGKNCTLKVALLPTPENAGEAADVVLPESDREPVMLDLATGQLVRMPRLPPETSVLEFLESIRELGKGDLLYDFDQGDHQLIFIRDATSEQAEQIPEGPPTIQAHLIGPDLPDVLTVTTTEGRRYEITILAADEESCTLRYLPLSADEDAGTGIRASLPNGVTIEFLAYSQLTVEGLQWWTPRREPTTIPDVHEADIEGLGTILAFTIEPPDIDLTAVSYRSGDRRVYPEEWRLGETNIWFVALEDEGNYANLELWPVRWDFPVSYTVPISADDVGKAVPVNECGISRVSLQEEPSGSPLLTVHQMSGQSATAVAITDANGVRYPIGRRERYSNRPNTYSYQPAFPCQRLKGIVFEARRANSASVKYANVSLTPQRRTDLRVDVGELGQSWQGAPSDERLSRLAQGLSAYAAEHDGMFPERLEQLAGYLPARGDFDWVIENVAYLGKDHKSDEPPGQPLAYDKELLARQGSTYVVYNNGLVLLEGSDRLPQLGLIGRGPGAEAWRDWLAAPPDANDRVPLSPGYWQEGMGGAPDGRVFISTVRDVEVDGRQHLCSLTTRAGEVWTPIYYESFTQADGRLWEKFTFDTPYDYRKVEKVRFESRSAAGKGAVIPTAHGEILAATTDAPDLPPALPAPPGRYALAFDGQDDYLYVPDSESLRTAEQLKIEMWFKPQFPPGPYDHKPGWGLLAKGAYLNANGVSVQGFGIALVKHDDRPNSLGFDFCRTSEESANMTEALRKQSDDWIHFSETFERGSYIPAPGQPLVVGRFLIPTELPFRGQIAEIRIWDGANSGDVEQYQGKALTGTEPGLLACWTFEEGAGPITRDLSPHANHARLGSSIAADDCDPAWLALREDAVPSPDEISGRVLDPNGDPVPGAQVALCLDDRRVKMRAGTLLPGGGDGWNAEIVKTDADGRFSFAEEADEFLLVVAHQTGFAQITNETFVAQPSIRLEPWGRVEGTLRIGPEPAADEVVNISAVLSAQTVRRFSYISDTTSVRDGRFVFQKVPPGILSVSRIERSSRLRPAAISGRVVVRPGETVNIQLGGTGRPVVGTLVLPRKHDGPGQYMYLLQPVDPPTPQPANWDQMIALERSKWRRQWSQTPQGQAYREAIARDVNRRSYTFAVDREGRFRIEDVVPREYKVEVWFHDESGSDGIPRPVGPYRAAIEVPPMSKVYLNEPLDLGELVLETPEP